MRVMTFNIQSGRNYPDTSDLNTDNCGKVIKQYNPDIVGLNEVHNGGVWGNQVEDIAKKFGYPYWYFGEAVFIGGSAYGNAIMSKYPIKLAETIVIPDPLVKDEDVYYETRCIVNVIIDCGYDLSVFVTHLGLADKEKENGINTILSLAEKTDEKIILMGDFNMHPDHNLIYTLGKVFKDTANYDKDSYFTYPSDFPEEKIDYIFTSEDITSETTFVVSEIASDHRAYISDIVIK